MRTMIKLAIPLDKANKAVRDGIAGKMFKNAIEQLQPEATYFWPGDGYRNVLLFIDLKDNTDLPWIADLFQAVDASITFHPVMNLDDFQAGLGKAAKRAGA